MSSAVFYYITINTIGGCKEGNFQILHIVALVSERNFMYMVGKQNKNMR